MNTSAQRLHETLAALAPIVGVSVPQLGTSSGVRIDFRPEATQAQRDAANAALASFDWSDVAQSAWLVAQAQTSAKNEMDTATAAPATASAEQRILRALAAVTLDEVNVLRQWIASFKSEVAGATSLADLKTRVAGLPSMPDRTAVQLRAAIENKLDGNA